MIESMRSLGFCLLVLSTWSACGCQGQPPRIKIEKATFLTLPGQLDAYGTTVARHPLIVTANSRGVVHHLMVKAGDVVTEDQVLCELRQETLELRKLALAASVAKARAQEEAAFERLQALEGQVYQGNIPEYRFRAAQVKAYWERAQRERAEDALQQLERRLLEGVLKAPQGALVTECLVQEGEAVEPNTPLFSLALGGSFSVKLYLQEALAVGTYAEVKLASGSLLGEVAEVASASWPLQVARIDWLETPLLVVGQPARVRFRLAPRKVLAVRASALRESGVFVPEGSVARWKPVETGSQDGPWIEIRSGLMPGAEVITWSSTPLRDGAKIRLSP